MNGKLIFLKEIKIIELAMAASYAEKRI